MKILSDRLALVLAEYSELPSSVQKVIDGNNKKDINMKGVLRLYKCGDKYLYVLPELFEKSELTSIYGNRIDRCNEDRCLNCLIRLVLVNILMEWMHDPNNLLQIKNRDYIETD